MYELTFCYVDSIGSTFKKKYSFRKLLNPPPPLFIYLVEIPIVCKFLMDNFREQYRFMNEQFQCLDNYQKKKIMNNKGSENVFAYSAFQNIKKCTSFLR